MKFSIIIPVYKVEKYLHECVNSVIAQTYADFEVILVDDGSPDSCPQMCDDYAKRDHRIKVIHQDNAGLACARNTGIRNAVGEYVICIDSDDYLKDVNVLQRIAEKTTDEVDIVLYGFQKYFESTQTYGGVEIPLLDGKTSTAHMLQKMLENNTYCGTAWTKAVRLNLLLNNDIKFRPGMISEDIDWYFQLLCVAQTFDSINDVAVVYRQRSGSISHSPKLNSLTDNLWILENWPTIFAQKVVNKELLALLHSVMAYYYANDLILYASYPAETAKPYKLRLKAQSFLLNYSITPRAITIRKFYKYFGFEITVILLKVMSKLKVRQ